MPVKIEGLSPKLEFVGWVEESDTPYTIEMHWGRGKRFVLKHPDFPDRLLRKDEIREKRETRNDCQEDDGS